MWAWVFYLNAFIEGISGLVVVFYPGSLFPHANTTGNLAAQWFGFAILTQGLGCALVADEPDDDGVKIKVALICIFYHFSLVLAGAVRGLYGLQHDGPAPDQCECLESGGDWCAGCCAARTPHEVGRSWQCCPCRWPGAAVSDADAAEARTRSRSGSSTPERGPRLDFSCLNKFNAVTGSLIHTFLGWSFSAYVWSYSRQFESGPAAIVVAVALVLGLAGSVVAARRDGEWVPGDRHGLAEVVRLATEAAREAGRVEGGQVEVQAEVVVRMVERAAERLAAVAEAQHGGRLKLADGQHGQHGGRQGSSRPHCVSGAAGAASTQGGGGGGGGGALLLSMDSGSGAAGTAFAASDNAAPVTPNTRLQQERARDEIQFSFAQQRVQQQQQQQLLQPQPQQQQQQLSQRPEQKQSAATVPLYALPPPPGTPATTEAAAAAAAGSIRSAFQPPSPSLGASPYQPSPHRQGGQQGQRSPLALHNTSSQLPTSDTVLLGGTGSLDGGSVAHNGRPGAARHQLHQADGSPHSPQLFGQPAAVARSPAAAGAGARLAARVGQRALSISADGAVFVPSTDAAADPHHAAASLRHVSS